jgi:hypothetical protein
MLSFKRLFSPHVGLAIAEQQAQLFLLVYFYNGEILLYENINLK